MTESNQKVEEQITEEYYSLQELTKKSWFPIKSVATLRELIVQGKIKGIDISTNEKLKRYKVSKQEVLKFLKIESVIIQEIK